MINRTILYFSWLTSLLLLLINGLLIVTAFVDKALYDWDRHRMEKKKQRIEPLVVDWIDGSEDLVALERTLRSRVDREAFFALLVKHGEKLDSDKRIALGTLTLVHRFLKRARRDLTLEAIKFMGVLELREAYPLLLETTESEDFEKRYNAYLALSRLPMNREQKGQFLDRLLTWGFSRDRSIEMIQSLDMSVEETLEEAENREEPVAKSALLRSLEGRLPDPLSRPLFERLLLGLKEDKEVRIATVVVLASSGDRRCLEPFIAHYKEEEAWEVRAAMARFVENLPTDDAAVSFLKEMVYDANWWVRNNAANALAKAGAAGLDALVDVTLDDRDTEVRDLAYSLLNASPDAHRTLKEL